MDRYVLCVDKSLLYFENVRYGGFGLGYKRGVAVLQQGQWEERGQLGFSRLLFLTMRTFIVVFQGLRTEHCHSKRPLGCLLECVSRESLKLGFSKLILYHTSVSLIKWLKHSKKTKIEKKIMKIDFANFVFELHRLVTSIAGKSGLSVEVSRGESEPVSDQPRQHEQPA